MRCSRCKRTIQEPVEGWNKCPKCGLSVFVASVKSAEELEDKGEEIVEEIVETPEAATESKKKEEEGQE